MQELLLSVRRSGVSTPGGHWDRADGLSDFTLVLCVTGKHWAWACERSDDARDLRAYDAR